MVKKDDLISPYYQEQNRVLHQTEEWGGSGYKHAKEVRRIIEDISAWSVLDYGCGRSTLRNELTDALIESGIKEYDPAIPGKDDLPEPADLVVCTDVLEHIEPEKIDSVLCHLHGLTNNTLFAVISLCDCARRLPDGTSPHKIIKSAHWWISELTLFHWTDMRFNIENIGGTDKPKRLRVWLKK